MFMTCISNWKDPVIIAWLATMAAKTAITRPEVQISLGNKEKDGYILK
jgi:hypothetical protein